MPAHEIPEQALEGVENTGDVVLDNTGRTVGALMHNVDVDNVAIQPWHEDWGGEVVAEDHAGGHAEEECGNSKGAHSFPAKACLSKR